MEDAFKFLECVVCTKTYGMQDIENGKYSAETMVCKVCYDAMAAAPREVHCFGKGTIIDRHRNDKRHFGYDPKAPECAKICPDRKVCRNYVLGRHVASTLKER